MTNAFSLVDTSAVVESEFSIPLLIVLIAWRLVLPVFLGYKAHEKGYSYVLVACIGVFVSTWICAGFALLLPDKNKPADTTVEEQCSKDEAAEVCGETRIDQLG